MLFSQAIKNQKKDFNFAFFNTQITRLKITTMTEKTRYTDVELQEFRLLVSEKLEKAQKEYEEWRNGITN